ncbi:O-antigen ligase family protein [Hydrogenophaga sp.]|uniref:O-antigen ligase family protein n=1 Tax=Hydrogenophaga sp. TaxID=1904254 RepID=UPI003F6F25E7
MSESLRALVVILLLSSAVFVITRPSFAQLIPTLTFNRWRNLWLFGTLAWFLASGFAIYVLLIGLAVFAIRRKESHTLGLYFLMIFVAPAVQVAIPGMGIVDHLFMLDHYRLLALLLLLPAALRLMKDRATPRFGRSPVDWMIAGYLIWTCMLSMLETSPTNAIRMVFLQYVDGFLPYYVASRSLRSEDDARSVFAGFLLGALLVSVIALFEVLRSWKLYQASISEMGLFVHQHYKTRGPFLRPGAALLDSIVLGLVVLIGMGALLYLKSYVASKMRVAMLWAILAIGLLASLSRAPWIAGILLFFLFVLQGPKAMGQLTKVSGALFLMLIVLSFFPAGKVIIDLIPIIGDAEQGSIEYRANWFSAAMPVIERNFWLGDVNVIQAPELEVMRQGEGIIDLVNMFLSVLLHYGAIGLFFFVGMFWRALWWVRRYEKISRTFSSNLSQLGRALISIVICLMLVLFTLSAISVVPILISTLVGLCTSYGFLVNSMQRDRKTSPTAGIAGGN